MEKPIESGNIPGAGIDGDGLAPGEIATDGSGLDNRISRRAVLRGGVGVAAGSLFAVTFGARVAKAAAATVSRPAVVAEKGGTLRIARAQLSDAENVDPAGALSAYEYLGALYNRLVKQAEDGTAIPDLAVHWGSSTDSKTWTFHLRKGVTFHSGQAFTSADAAYTVARILAPATASPQGSVLAAFLKPSGISTPDLHTLVLKLHQPNSEFDTLLTNYQCYIIPKGSGATIGKTGIGTGPFSLVSFVPGGRGVLKANRNYFGGAPRLAGLQIDSIADAQARVNALLAGQIDLISLTNLDAATTKVVDASSIATTTVLPNYWWYEMPMLCDDKPFTDSAVRQAFKTAYQPTNVLGLALAGRGTVANNNPVSPRDANYLDYKPDMDPEKAASTLRKAGLLSSTQDLWTSTWDPTFTPLAIAYQASVARAGIKIDIKTASADSYYTSVWIKKPFCVTNWTVGRPTGQLLYQIFRSGSDYNDSRWDDPTFDSILAAAQSSSNPATRKLHYQDAQKYLIDHSGSVIPFFADSTTGLSRRVVNYKEYAFEFDYVNIGFKPA